MKLSTIEKTLFGLVEIEDYEVIENDMFNMVDITVEDDETFCFADGIISHNSALSSFLPSRDPSKHAGYALRGKVMNTHGMKREEVALNKELAELLSIIGLDLYSTQINEDPKDLFELEYEGESFIVAYNDSIITKSGKQLRVNELQTLMEGRMSTLT